ncbi:endonuclease domain-containing protein [Streptomyces sp. JV185]|uniref:endonuclease domain-containing protein n=1 Tax=Streptomyces sp. JV185 TaxID=858638 RepID=UPI003FA79C4E
MCRLQPLRTGWHTSEERRWPACYNRLTADQQDAYVATRKALEARDDEWWRTVAPACWGWPLENTFKSWEPTFDVGPRDHQYTQDAADDLLKLCDDAETLSDWQSGRCAICSRRSDLVEDHDHTTGLARGPSTEPTRKFLQVRRAFR